MQPLRGRIAFLFVFGCIRRMMQPLRGRVAVLLLPMVKARALAMSSPAMCGSPTVCRRGAHAGQSPWAPGTPCRKMSLLEAKWLRHVYIYIYVCMKMYMYKHVYMHMYMYLLHVYGHGYVHVYVYLSKVSNLAKRSTAKRR